MTYLITYLTSDHEQHILEWVAPAAWSPAAVSQAFAERHPGAQLLSLEPSA
jgi:hypothetical protein